MLEPGAIVGGYRIEGVLGRGGMGVVYEATQLSLDRRIALKALRAELADDPSFVERFRREGRLQASFEHPHVIDVYEAFEADEGLFLAMRLERGVTLAQLLGAGDLDGACAVRLLRQVAEALDAAHAAGLVHRDVKPSNVLVGEGDHAYLGDFGLTKAGDGTEVTGTGGMVGTLSYLAPEIIHGDPATPASDRYAFAAMLFECLSGEVVFPRASEAAVLYAHTSEPPPAISERRLQLPRALDSVLATALAKVPGERPESARALVDTVERVIGAERLQDLGPPEPAAAPVPGSAPATPRPRPPPRRRTASALVAGALAGAALGAGAMALAGSGGYDSDARTAEPAPRLTAGTEALGSGLAPVEGLRTVDCRGRRPSTASPGCSIMQKDLPGRTVLAPRDGAIRSWAVRGAVGELSLQILRERGGKLKQVSKSQVEVASDSSPHLFSTNLPVEAGDRIALVVSPGAGVGIRPDADGATVDRWLPRLRGFFEVPTDGPGTGFDHELLLRADYVPGGEVRLPPQTTGAKAASAPEGKILDRGSVRLVEGGQRVEIAVVELDATVALDLLRGGKRVARVRLSRFRPEGRLTTFAPTPEGFVDLEWINLDSSRALFEFFGFDARSFIYYGS